MNYIATAAAEPATGAIAEIYARAEKSGSTLAPQPFPFNRATNADERRHRNYPEPQRR